VDTGSCTLGLLVLRSLGGTCAQTTDLNYVTARCAGPATGLDAHGMNLPRSSPHIWGWFTPHRPTRLRNTFTYPTYELPTFARGVTTALHLDDALPRYGQDLPLPRDNFALPHFSGLVFYPAYTKPQPWLPNR